jgi:uncharacterized protein (TIGR03000 family)
MPYTVPPTTPPTTDKPSTDKPSTDKETVAPATIVVNLPAAATLTVDGKATMSTSARRVFVSPELAAGRDYFYDLKAEFMKDGKPVVVNKRITVRAGAESVVELGAELADIASR